MRIYSWIIAGSVGFLCGAAMVGRGKPALWETKMTAKEYYGLMAGMLPPPVQVPGFADDALEREYFSPGLIKKAFAGNMNAQYELAVCYDMKTATPAQRAEAAYWYLESARQGHEVAMVELYHMYLHGIAVPKSTREAMVWLHRSAELGNTYAAWILGERYLAGEGVHRNQREGIRWLTEASESFPGARKRLRSLGIQPPPSKYIKDDG
jgi:TPR repeat protein